MKAVRTGKKVFPLIAAICFSILFFLPVEAGIWERHYWKGFLYIIDEYLFQELIEHLNSLNESI